MGYEFSSFDIRLQPANLLKSVEGLENLENLTILHLRDNLIETLDGFGPSMKSLQYVNIR